MDRTKIEKNLIVEWINNAINTVNDAKERAVRKWPQDDYYICACNGKLDAFGVLKDKIECGQFDAPGRPPS